MRTTCKPVDRFGAMQAFDRAVAITVASAAVFLAPVPAMGQDSPVTCVTCHGQEAKDHAGSTHALLSCQDCHGGPKQYQLATAAAFDHGDGFRGKPARSAIPQLCGSCHSDVERMNPYGLRTDQLSRYWTSGHGKALKQDKDERVAVCIDCHGNHGVRSADDPASMTHPTNVPDTCAKCHADAELMAEYDLPTQIVDEYRQSVHGKLLRDGDTGAPNCATCHGNHSAMPPGVADVWAVCGQCHQHAASEFATSVHSTLEEFGGCVRCHGGGEDRHFHLVERMTSPTGALIQRFEDLLKHGGAIPTAEETARAIHPNPRTIINRTLSTCLDCHEDLEDDESLPRLFDLLTRIEQAERRFVMTGRRLDQIGAGVLLVDNQRFKFEDAKTKLLELAPTQHSLDIKKVDTKVAELNTICAEIDDELDVLERGLRLRRMALIPIWLFTLGFATLWYVKYKQLHKVYVTE